MGHKHLSWRRMRKPAREKDEQETEEEDWSPELLNEEASEDLEVLTDGGDKE